jgi:hypothetical protein
MEQNMHMTNSIFDCYSARLHTLSPAPTLREANHDQLVAHHRNMEAINADKIAPRFGSHSDDADDMPVAGSWSTRIFGANAD